MSTYALKKLSQVDSKKLKDLPPLLRRLLLLRGVKTKKAAETFLHPNWERDTHDPYLMKGMKKAVKRIFKAMDKKETIAIWSDYDMDGIPGAVVLFDFFKKLEYSNVVHITPHRNLDGFGLNKKGIDTLKKKKVTLMITVDCGIGDNVQVSYAKKNGIDTIITDHHIPNGTLPKAHVILNPKQEGCEYPFDMLAGAGVAFKLAQALIIHTRKIKHKSAPVEGWEKWMLDMVGMATVADMVPLTGENRALAHFGMLVLRKSRRLGLQALLRKARSNQRYLNEEDVSFTIAPRINAASRMGHARDAFSLLSSTEAAEAGALADALDKINNTRKVLVATMKRETKRKLAKRTEIGDVIVLGNPEWKPSLLGLVAGSLAEEYNKPVFLWGREEGNVIKGSCRSEGTTDIFALMDGMEERFIEFGGHAFSGGFELEEEKVHDFESALHDVFKKNKNKHTNKKKLYDEVLSLSDVTRETYSEINKLAPFGEGNPKPLFLFKDVPVKGVRMFGKGKEHLELQFEKESGGTVKAIQFFTTPESLGIEFHENTVINFVAHIELSNFMGRSEIRLRLVDVLSLA